MREGETMVIGVATLDGARARVSQESLEELRTAVRGDVVTAHDPAYDSVRPLFNLMHRGEPALVVRCTGTADVVAAVNFAQHRDLLLAVRGGGHSVAGLSTCDGGMLLDLAPMRGVQVDPERRVVHVQGGALWGEVDHETQAFGLATPGGVVSDTGVAGLTLGGGYGWIRRKHGLACDNVISAQVVCADGTVRTASAESNPDLYWAIRGGGGNFGVVTSFTFRLHEVGPIVPFAGVFYPIEDGEQILRRWRDYLATAPEELTSASVTMTLPADPGLPEAVRNRACMIIGAVYADTDVDAGMKALQPLRELGSPLADISQPLPYTGVQAAFDPFFPRGELLAYLKTQYVNELTDDAIALVAAKALQRPSPRTLVVTWQMGGAIAKVPPEETAFAARTPPYMVAIDGFWTDPAHSDEVIAWVRSAWDEVGRFGTGGVYLNLTGLADEHPSAGVDSAYGRNLRRLAQIKKVYDPANFFRLNNNIAPAP
jgi:FAD/FMN-containing dehydrogenase